MVNAPGQPCWQITFARLLWEDFPKAFPNYLQERHVWAHMHGQVRSRYRLRLSPLFGVSDSHNASGGPLQQGQGCVSSRWDSRRQRLTCQAGVDKQRCNVPLMDNQESRAKDLGVCVMENFRHLLSVTMLPSSRLPQMWWGRLGWAGLVIVWLETCRWQFLQEVAFH